MNDLYDIKYVLNENFGRTISHVSVYSYVSTISIAIGVLLHIFLLLWCFFWTKIATTKREIILHVKLPNVFIFVLSLPYNFCVGVTSSHLGA